MRIHASFRVNLRSIALEQLNSFRLASKTAVRLNIRKALQVLGGTLVVLLLSLPTFSQGSAGRLVGAVIDSNGGAIAGATVTVLDVQRGTTRTLTTDESGSYNAPNLIPGTYKVRAEFKGFRATERQNIILEVGQEIRVDLTLQPGEQTQTITVTESIPLVDTTNAELGGTLQSEIINNLPMNGRNFANLLQLRPGVTIYPGGSGWTQSTNGMRAHDNVYMVDGINSNDPWMAQAVWDSVMASGDTGTLISIDAIDEFKTQENPRAEYGWKPGGIVNVGIKSGTNSYHGTAYAYGRDGSWDARNVFNAPPAVVPSVTLEQYGATFGGPIKKDKLFFFLTFERQQYALGSTQIITEPITAAGITNNPAKPGSDNLQAACLAALAVGAPGSGTAGALTALSASLAGLSNSCVPLSNYPGLFPVNPGTGSNITQIGNGLVNNNTIHSGLAKVDYHINEKHSISGSYFISPGKGIVNDSPAQTNLLWETNQYARSQGFAGNWTWTPTSSLVNEARVGYAHYYQVFLSNDAAQDPANYNFNGSTYHYYTGQTNTSLYGGFPATTIFGFNGPMGASWPKVVGPDGILQVLDHVSVLRGKHAFKFGGEMLYNQSTSDVTANAKGPIRFSNIQDFFSGFPNGVPNAAGKVPDKRGTATILTGDLLRHFTFSGYALFLQDDWRVKPRLTVNLGLRYEINTVPKERDNQQGNFNPNFPTGVEQVGFGATSVYNGDHNNFAPRLGIAWDVKGDGRTVVRAGGGVFYEQLSLDVFNGIGNSFGLRTAPSGATLVSCSVAVPLGGSCPAGSAVVQSSPGTIGVINTAFAGTPIINGTVDPITGQTTAGIPFNWANNGPNTSIFTFQAFCGDGATAVPSGPLAGFKPQQCNVMGVNPNLRTPYVFEYSLDLQRAISHTVSLEVGYVGNTGRKFISALDINQPQLLPGGLSPGWYTPLPSGGTAASVCLASAPAYGACGNPTIPASSRPFFTKFPYYKFIDEYGNYDTSNYNSLQTTLTARNLHGLTLTGGYTYSHSLGVASDQGTGGGNFLPIDSTGSIHHQLYGPSSFDIRHRGTISVTYALPGRSGFGQILQGWSINSVAIIQSGLPWGISDASIDYAGTAEMTGNSAANQGGQWDFFGNPADFMAIHNYRGVTPGPNGAPGIPFFPGGGPAGAATANATCNAKAAALGPLAVASLTDLGCYALGSSVLVPPPYGGYGTTSRGMWRDHGFRNVDLSVTKAFKFKERLTAQFRAEVFNALNHPNFVNPAGGPGGGGASLDPSGAGTTTGLAYVSNTPDIASSNPVLGSGGPRAIQAGLKLIF
jgi:hypothetical protein